VKRILSMGAALVAVLSIGAGSALAIPIPGTIDQQQTLVPDTVNWTDTYALAQTFTAGQTGNLVAIGVYVGAQQPQIAGKPAAVKPALADNIHLAVSETSGGVPVGTFLYGPTTASLPATLGWQYFVLPTPAPITAGNKYAIVMAAISPFWVTWAGECQTNSYTGGEALVQDSSKKTPAWQTVVSWGTNADTFAACQQDFAFKTFVEAPFESFQGATSTPGSTPPPTSTPAPADGSSTPALLLIFASMAAGAAFVTVRRIDSIRR
jgi:hypothetical protein